MNPTANPTKADRSGEATVPLRAASAGDGLWQVIWYRRRTVLLAVLLCLEAGILYVCLATPVYTSTSRLYVEPGGPGAIAGGGRSTILSKNYLQTQCELIRSAPVLRAALRRSDAAGLTSLQGQGDPVALLKENLEVKAGKKDDIICVSLDSPYPWEADLLVNNVVAAFVGSHSGGSRSAADEVLKTLKSEKARLEEELAASFQAMEDFKQTHGIISLDDGKLNVQVRKLGELSAALTAAELETIVARAERQAARAVMNDPAKIRYFTEQSSRSGWGQAGRERAQLSSAINEMESQLTVLRRECSDEHPAVQSLRARITQARQWQAEAGKELAENHLALCGQKFSAAEQRELEIRCLFLEQREEIEQLDAKAARYALLEAAFKRSGRINELLGTRISAAALAAKVAPVSVRVVEQASSPDEPTSPQRAPVGVMSLGGGLMLGVMLALLAGRLDRRIRSASEVSAVLQLPLLGAVPAMRRGRSPLCRTREVCLNPVSSAAEAYRDIRTAVYFALRDQEVKTLLVTSAQAGDGKTTLVSNLGVAMAQVAQRTLILDADLRNPVQHEVFNVRAAGGLTGVLAGTVSLEEAVQPTEIDRLEVLPCGPAPDHPAEVLHSPAFRGLLEDLSERYDRVLIDSAPLMSVTDSRILGAICDVTILVLRAEKSTHPVAEQVIEDLLDVGARILGGVINAVPRGNRRYGRYSHYGYKGKRRPKKVAVSSE